jgi:ubiquinone/menaquinone biosynthesis C-methylase UbiE
MTIMSHENLAHFYDEAYSEASAAGDRHARWRKLSALGKADHAIQLCERAGFRPGSIAEIGCGDGAVLAELGARGLAGQLHGFEVSEEAAVIARGRGTPGLVGVSVYDGLRLPARDSEFDLAILSHVLEHVSDPVALLREAARVARAVVLEVPLEANLSASRPGKRKGAARIGHMQALDRRAVRSLVEQAGMRVRDELLDPLPLEVHMFFAPAGAPRMRAIAKAVVRRGVFALSPQLAQRAFTLHYAALCA